MARRKRGANRRPRGRGSPAPKPEHVVRMPQAADEFLVWCEAMDKSAHTVTHYRWALQKLEAVVDWLPCTEADVLRALLIGDLKSETKHHAVRVYRTFFNYVIPRYPGVDDVTQNLNGFRKPRENIRVLTSEEVQALFAAAATDYRDYLLIGVIMDTGLRIGEVASIRLHSIRDNWVHVEGKVGHRRVPVSPTIANALREFAQGDVVWVGRSGEAMSVDSLKAVVRRIFVRADIRGERASAHTLRHTFATKFIEAGGEVVHLKEILGHKTLAMTMRYVTLAGRAMRDEHARYTPLRTLGLILPEEVAPDRPPLDRSAIVTPEIGQQLALPAWWARPLDIERDDDRC